MCDHEEDFSLSPSEKAIRKKQDECKCPSWVCPICHKHKDNMRPRDMVIDECVQIVYFYRDRPIEEILDMMCSMQNKSWYM